MLRRGGHQVDLVEYDNHQIAELGRARTAIRTVWSHAAVLDVRRRLSATQYDILHVQNYFPLISPAVLLESARMGVATVQSLRNYRLLCVAGQLFRDGHECQICVGKLAPWSGIRHGCYRGSMAGSATLAAMIATHKALGTWHEQTDALVPVSDYVRDIYVRGGFPAERLHTKPNVSLANAQSRAKKRQVIFAGRLTKEKGVQDLIAAWRMAALQSVQLLIVGNGPYEPELRTLAEDDPTIEFAGHHAHDEVMEMIALSRVLVLPAAWAEPFGRTAVEAFSVGTPVLASAKGGLIEIVERSGGGATFPAGDVPELARLIARAINDQAWWDSIATAAQAGFADNYSMEAVLHRTEQIYAVAINRRRRLSPASGVLHD